MALLYYKGLRIPFDELKNVNEVKEKLTVRPTFIPGYGPEPESFKLYKIQNKNGIPNSIIVPKFYGQSIIKDYENKERTGTSISMKFKGLLRDDQDSFVDEIISKLKTDGGCVACAPTGSGKTVMAGNLITKLKLKTLIVVHKEFLGDQWKDRLEQFTDIDKITFIRGPTIDTSGQVVIAMLQSLSMKTYDNSIFDCFGLVIVDECHHICTKTFSKALDKISTKYMVGLSATPDRKDGLTKVLSWYMGDILVKESQEQNIKKPTVRIVRAVYENPIEIKRNYQKKIIIPDLINKIVADKFRNNQLIELIRDILIEFPTRSIILLSDRRDHCIELHERLTALNINSGPYIGGMSKEELEQSNQKQVILATFAMAAEGYDNAKLDTLIFGTGKSSNLLQCCGRILRRPNPNYPLIIDIHDIDQYSSCKARIKFYKQEKYTVIEAEEPEGPEGPEDGPNGPEEPKFVFRM